MPLSHFITKCYYKTDIIKQYDSYFIIKCDKHLLQNTPDFTLQNVTVITKCDDFIIQNEAVITNCDVYYKMCRHSSKYISLANPVV